MYYKSYLDYTSAQIFIALTNNKFVAGGHRHNIAIELRDLNNTTHILVVSSLLTSVTSLNKNEYKKYITSSKNHFSAVLPYYAQ